MESKQIPCFWWMKISSMGIWFQLWESFPISWYHVGQTYVFFITSKGLCYVFFIKKMNNCTILPYFSWSISVSFSIVWVSQEQDNHPISLIALSFLTLNHAQWLVYRRHLIHIYLRNTFGTIYDLTPQKVTEIGPQLMAWVSAITWSHVCITCCNEFKFRNTEVHEVV